LAWAVRGWVQAHAAAHLGDGVDSGVARHPHTHAMHQGNTQGAVCCRYLEAQVEERERQVVEAKQAALAEADAAAMAVMQVLPASFMRAAILV
jgi:hypothetical protein